MIFAAALTAAVTLDAAKKPVVEDWVNPAVNQRNRVEMSARFNADGETLSLNGTWKFKWYETIESRSRDFFTPGLDDSAWDEMPVPGLISGGPNGKMNYPNVKDRLANVPPAKHLIDETEFADMNEIAIYWNSPTVFTAAYFNGLTAE